MNTVKVRDIEIGAGAPKIIVPIVGVTKNDIIEEAKTFHSIPVDVVEWRVDWFEGVFDFAQVEDVLKDLREALGNIPLLMTFRTSKEGGEKAIEPAVLKQYLADETAKGERREDVMNHFWEIDNKPVEDTLFWEQTGIDLSKLH